MRSKIPILFPLWFIVSISFPINICYFSTRIDPDFVAEILESDSLNLCQLLLTRLITRRLSSSSVRFLRNRWLETRLVNMKKKRKKKERKRKKKKVARRDCSFKKKKKLKLRDAFMRLPDIARHWNSYFLIGTHHRRRRHARESKGRGEQSKIGHETRCKSFDSGWILGRIDASVRRTVNEERKGRWILFSLSFFFW